MPGRVAKHVETSVPATRRGTPPPPASTPGPARTGPVGGTRPVDGFTRTPSNGANKAIEVHRTLPFEEDKVIDRIVGMINGSKTSIDAAFYEIGDHRVVDALVEAKKRGVNVRVVTDDIYFRSSDQTALLKSHADIKTGYIAFLGALKRIELDKPNAKGPTALEKLKALEDRLGEFAPSDKLPGYAPNLDGVEAFIKQARATLKSGNRLGPDDRAVLKGEISRISYSAKWDRLRLSFRPAYGKLVAAGIPVNDDKRGSMNHNKFMVVDNSAVWVGSYNISGHVSDDVGHAGLPMAADNALYLPSSELAAVFSKEFQQMAEGKFGTKKVAVDLERRAVVDGIAVEAYFSPTDPIPELMGQSLEKALVSGGKPKIRIATYLLNYKGNERMVNALIEAKKKGADVQVMLGNWHAKKPESAFWQLQKAGVHIEIADQNIMMHNKFMTVEDRNDAFVWTGSANMTGPAYTQNDESIVKVDDRKTTKSYSAIFEELKAFSAEAPK